MLTPKRTITVALDLESKTTPVTAKVGDLVTLELPPVELAGYGWQLFLHDARFLKQMTEILPPATAGGRPTVSFYVLRASPKSLIRFLLVKQDGSREAQPIDGHHVVFKIQ